MDAPSFIFGKWLGYFQLFVCNKHTISRLFNDFPILNLYEHIYNMNSLDIVKDFDVFCQIAFQKRHNDVHSNYV